MSFFGLIFISLLTLAVATYKDQHCCNNRTVMVHMPGWRFCDIAKECETFLGPKGYCGVQKNTFIMTKTKSKHEPIQATELGIFYPRQFDFVLDKMSSSVAWVSPVVACVESKNKSWHDMYQPTSYKIGNRYGNQTEFEHMVKTCNRVGVRIYVEVVLNHMAPNKEQINCLCYPDVPYTYKHFHLPECIIKNYNNATEVRNCELCGYPDLNQRNNDVIIMIKRYLNKLTEMGCAGFCILHARHMSPMDLKCMYDKLDNLSCDHGFPQGARPFIFHHVVDDEGCCVSKWEYNNIGCVEERHYSFILSKLIVGLDLSLILKLGLDLQKTCGLLPSLDAIVRIDDHYTQRGLYCDGIDILTYKKLKQYKIAVCLMLAYPYGLPFIMSSYEFDDNDQGPPMYSNGSICSPEIDDNDKCNNGFVCEHRFFETCKMVEFRNMMKNEDLKNYWCNGKDQIAFALGIKAFVVFNLGDKDLCQKLYTGLPDGTYCDILTGGLKDGKCCGKSVIIELGFALIKNLLNGLGLLAFHVKQAILKVKIQLPLLGVNLPLK